MSFIETIINNIIWNITIVGQQGDSIVELNWHETRHKKFNDYDMIVFPSALCIL